MKDIHQQKNIVSILQVADKFAKVAGRLNRLHQSAKERFHNDGKLDLQFQRETMFTTGAIKGDMLELQGSLQRAAELGAESGRSIIELMNISYLAVTYLQDRKIFDDFLAYVAKETAGTVKPAGIMDKLKFWRCK